MTADTAQPSALEWDDELDGEQRRAEEPTELFITFRLGREWYGLPIAAVREVVPAAAVTELPSAPGHILGVLNLRGTIVPVIDPKRVFGLPPTEATDRCRIVVIESVEARTGLWVDEVGEVATVPRSQLEPPLDTIEAPQAQFLSHTCRFGDRLLAIPKAEKLLGSASAATVAEHRIEERLR